MALNLEIIQSPLEVCPSHSDHTWNVKMNDYSAYTDIRLIVDIYKNPYLNDYGSNQDSGQVARLLVPVNEVGHCIFNIETIIINIVDKNPRNLGGTTSATTMVYDPYEVQVANSQTTSVNLDTSQATIVNARNSTIGLSNGFNGYEGFQNIYQINEYRILFGVQYTSGGTTTQIFSTDYSAYTSYTGGTILPNSASTQPYGVMIWPGIQDNKQMSQKYYYSGNNLTGQYNYLNTKVYDYQMSTGSTKGEFMSIYGPETIPMQINGANTYNTRFRTHYYKCPIVIGFMFGENQLFDNSSLVQSITYLQKTQQNTQLNYDVSLSYNINSRPKPYGLYSYLNERIVYGVFKQNPNTRTNSDTAIYLSSSQCSTNYSTDGVSEIVQYKMVDEECLNNPISFLFLNRNGIWDTYTFTKKSEKRYAPNRKTYSQQKSLNTRYWNRQSYDSNETVFYGVADELFTVQSGFVLQNDGVIIEDLLLSPYVYIIDDNWLPLENQDFIYPYLIPCTVLNKDVKVFEQKYQRIFQYTIELKQTPYRPYILSY